MIEPRLQGALTWSVKSILLDKFVQFTVGKMFSFFWGISSLENIESYPLRGYILGSGAPGTNAVGASGAINGMKRWSATKAEQTNEQKDGQMWRWK